MSKRKLSFYDQNTREAIKKGIKTIETRALNPEEPERYFGDSSVWDELIFVNKWWENQEQKVKVTQVYKRENFQDLWDFDHQIVRKIYSDPQEFDRIKSLEELKQWWDFLPGYREKIEKNGLIGRAFVLLS